MKKLLPWILLFLVVFLATMDHCNGDSRARAIMAQSDADLEAAAAKVRERTWELDRHRALYEIARGEVERLETELSRKPRVVTRTVVKEIPSTTPAAHLEGPGNPLGQSIDWGIAWQKGFDQYILGNQFLRQEHDRIVAEYEGLLAIERQAKADLIIARDKLAGLRGGRWGFTLGVTGGVSFSGRPYIGLGGCWGWRW